MQSYEIFTSMISLGIVVIAIGLLVNRFDFLTLLMLTILIISIILLRLLWEDFIDLNQFTLPKFKRTFGATLLINVLSGMVILSILQSSVYFYFNYLQGYFFSFIFIFMFLGLYQLLSSNDLFQNIDFTLLRIILTIYLPYYIYAVVFNLSLLELNVFNPVLFFTGLIINVPSMLIANLTLYISNNTLTETFYVQISSLIIFYFVVFFSLKKLFPFLQSKDSNYESWNNFKRNKIQLVPYLGMIYMVSILSTANGLNELYRISIWVLAIYFVTITLLYNFKQESVTKDLLQIKITLWIILILVLQYINPIFFNLFFVQQLLLSIQQNSILVFILLYSFPSVLTLITVYYILKLLPSSDVERLNNYSFFFFLVLLITYFSLLIFRFLLIILLEFLATFIIFKWDENHTRLSVINSINIKHSVNFTFLSKISSHKKIIIQKTSKIALFFIAFIIIT